MSHPFIHFQDSPRRPEMSGVLPDSDLAAVSSKNRWRALLIGIGDYQAAAFPDLVTPRNDVETLAEVLQGSYGFDVTPLLDGQATARGIKQAIKDLYAKCGPQDNVLIYFAGHGILEARTDKGYWLPADATDSNDAISNAEIRDLVADIPARRVLLVSDSCFAGAFLQRRAVGVATAELIKDPEESVRVSASLAADTRQSREVLTSGGVAPVPDAGRGLCRTHSPFACTLLQALDAARPGAVLSTVDIYREILVQNTGSASGSPAKSGPGELEKMPRYSTFEGHKEGQFFFVRKK